MRIGVLLIGDELLSGKRLDRHLPKVIELLHERGLELHWARMIGDDPALLVETLSQTLATDDLVFSFGGIGATPDDGTRQAAADAAGRPLVRHPEARVILERKYGERAWPRRIQMADFPEGAALIPNLYNDVPGFSLGDHHFVPGFPEMAWPMVEWLLDHRYAHLHGGAPAAEFLIRVYAIAESDLVPLMERFAEHFPELRLASLPHIDARQPHIELGVRGEAARGQGGRDWLVEALSAEGVAWEDAGRRG